MRPNAAGSSGRTSTARTSGRRLTIRAGKRFSARFSAAWERYVTTAVVRESLDAEERAEGTSRTAATRTGVTAAAKRRNRVVRLNMGRFEPGGIRLARWVSARLRGCDTLVRGMEARDPATGLEARVSLGGAGRVSVSTGLSVLDHLLELLAAHAGFDLALEVEPGGPEAEATTAGRALGEALRDVVGGEGVKGSGFAIVPADEALASVALEASGRPLLISNVDLSEAHVAGIDRDLVTSFLRELAEAGGLTLHVRLLHGEDARHVLEAIFKALGGALAAAAAAAPGKE